IGASRDPARHVVLQTVLPNSPAADAGLVKGDVILAIDGTPSEDLSPAQLLALARRPVGTELHFTVKTDAAQRDVTLTLRELLCNPGSSRCDPWVESAGDRKRIRS
ncbi:MAG TPA: PDZ domain-containing protein, partial [Xanthomonadales bacterium]|nr:PDZ domain-containing protein [Xanthomonadales bacterium]